MNAVPPGQWMTQRAGILANDKLFQHWLKETNSAWRMMDGTDEEKAAMLTRVFCRVKSRKEIVPGTEAARLFDEMIGKYETWRACLEDTSMNAIIPVAPQSGGLVPTSMAEAMKLAEMMASAKLVPVGLQKSPADCLMVVQQAVRWQMDAFAVAQECSVIQGKLMHSGKLVAAVVNARGNLTQRLSFEYKGAGPERTITVSGQLQGEPQPRTVDVIFKNAATNNKVWQTQPDQQLMYHGVRVWARRHTPELMLGVYSPEEFDEPTATPRRPARPAPNVMLPAHDQYIGEVTEPPPGAAPDAADVAPSPSDELPAKEGGGATLSIEDMAREAAQRSEETFRKFYRSRSGAEQARINRIGDELRGLMGGNR